MPVYAIRCGERGPVKLGHGDPESRRADLQVAHWEDLRILRVWEGGEPEERQLHVRFADLRLRGEWFSFSRAMLGDVGLVEIIAEETSPPDPAEVAAQIYAAPESPQELGARLSSLRRQMRLSQADLAASAKTARSTIASIEAGHDMPGRGLLLRICHALNVPLGALVEAA